MATPDLELRALEALDALLDGPDAAHDARLRELDAADPGLARRVRSLLGADAAAARSLPTRPPQPVAPLSPPERIGPYRLTTLLGEGGMGAVWRGERDDGVFEQSVAVKLMHPGAFAAAFLGQFAVERQVLARLRHPNIAQIFDGGADAEGRAWFVMELVAGVPLPEHLLAQRPSLEATAALLLPVCAAVQHAHGALVAHADIKPGNIMVDADGRPKLLDFGVARNLGETAAEPRGHGLTPAYASPQRLAGERPMPADDVYALGAVLHELATGEPPTAAPPPPLAPPVPAEYAAVVAKATAADPAGRYASAEALADDLRRWLGRFPVRALPPSWRRSARHLVRRRPGAVGAATAGLAGLLVALAVISALLVRSERDRRDADLGFARARGMAHYMLFDVFDRLTDTPGTLPLRKELADRAQSYLHDLSTAPRAPSDVRAEAAIGFMQLAGVEGLFSAGDLGDRPAAEASLAQAAALLDTAGPAARATPRWQYAQGRLRLFQGFRRGDQGDGPAAALPDLREAVRLLAAAATALPGDPEVAADLWQARLVLANALGSLRDPAGQLAATQEVLGAYAAAPAAADRSEKTPLLLARSHKEAGDAQYALGDKPAALRSYAEAEALAAAENERHPRRSRTLMELLDARWNLASLLSEAGAGDLALRLYDSALAQGRERLRLEPDHDGLQRMVLLLDGERAALLAQLGRHDEAVAAVRTNLLARQAAADARPDDQVAQRQLLAGLRPAGDVEARAGHGVEACTLYRRAADGYAAFLRRFALPPRIVATELADVAAKLGACR